MELSYAGRLNVSIMPRVHQGMEKQVSNMGSQKRSKQSAAEGIPIDYLSNTYQHVFTYVNTSSTAQGGGGSFKDRKPIGEIGCCESGMAERSH